MCCVGDKTFFFKIFCHVLETQQALGLSVCLSLSLLFAFVVLFI